MCEYFITVDPRRQQQCPICFKWLSKRTHLPTHIRDQHSSTTTYQHKCDICNKHYRTRNALANHKSLQHRPKAPYQQIQQHHHRQQQPLPQHPEAVMVHSNKGMVSLPLQSQSSTTSTASPVYHTTPVTTSPTQPHRITPNQIMSPDLSMPTDQYPSLHKTNSAQQNTFTHSDVSWGICLKKEI